MFKPIFEKLGRDKTIIIIFVLLVFDLVLFGYIFFGVSAEPGVYFLDVGQGDSELIILPGGVEILIDGGSSNGRALAELTKILPFTDRYIDLVVMTHPQLDHFGGLISIINRYEVGAFLWNGVKGQPLALRDLEEVINKNRVRNIVLKAGDKIKYQNSVIDVLSPGQEKFKDINENSLVFNLIYKDTNFLFTGDIGKRVEELIKDKVGKIDILKVAHHGSKYSSSAEFLNIIQPKVAVIEVGENSYGHPTEETLEKLEQIGASIFRTDEHGTIKVIPKDNTVEVFITNPVKSLRSHGAGW
jgi:competence protein ComEC